MLALEKELLLEELAGPEMPACLSQGRWLPRVAFQAADLAPESGRRLRASLGVAKARSPVRNRMRVAPIPAEPV